MNWSVPRIWENGDVWILGGGSSVTRQFDIPDQVVNAVVSGKLPPNVYSSYLEALHNKHVIGINVAYLIGNWIDIVFFGDNGFFLRHREGLANFQGLKVTCNHQAAHEDWVRLLGKDNNHPKGISTKPNLVSWNGNSGAAAISIAAHAGAKRIILLGFDMKLDINSKQHWHNLYGKGAVIKPEKIKALPFGKHLIGFEQIAKDAKRLKIEILNACPDSAITQFPKYTIKELLYDNT